MSAAEAIKAARAVGIGLGIDGDALTLEAAVAPLDAALTDSQKQTVVQLFWGA